MPAGARLLQGELGESESPSVRLGRSANGFAVELIIVGTIALAVVLAALLPGAGFIGAITVVVIGLTAVVWLLSAGASKQAPGDVARNTGAARLPRAGRRNRRRRKPARGEKNGPGVPRPETAECRAQPPTADPAPPLGG
jgi:hypothetical protein